MTKSELEQLANEIISTKNVDNELEVLNEKIKGVNTQEILDQLTSSPDVQLIIQQYQNS